MVQLEGDELPELGLNHLQHVHVLRAHLPGSINCTKMDAMGHFLSKLATLNANLPIVSALRVD